MPNTYVAYIDESGSEGGDGKAGASEFVIISAAVCLRDEEKLYQQMMDGARADFRKSATWQFPKFSEMKSDIRRHRVCELIGKLPVIIVSVITHKPTIQKLSITVGRDGLYFQLSQYLVERLSWACRDDWKGNPMSVGNAKLDIIFSENKTLRYDTFKNNIGKMMSNPTQYTSKTEWKHIDPAAISSLPHKTGRPGLLVADYVASAFGRALEPKEFGVTDDRFVRLFSEKVYHWNGKHMSNGIKVWPREAETMVRADPRFGWLKFYYGC